MPSELAASCSVHELPGKRNMSSLWRRALQTVFLNCAGTRTRRWLTASGVNSSCVGSRSRRTCSFTRESAMGLLLCRNRGSHNGRQESFPGERSRCIAARHVHLSARTSSSTPMSQTGAPAPVRDISHAAMGQLYKQCSTPAHSTRERAPGITQKLAHMHATRGTPSLRTALQRLCTRTPPSEVEARLP